MVTKLGVKQPRLGSNLTTIADKPLISLNQGFSVSNEAKRPNDFVGFATKQVVRVFQMLPQVLTTTWSFHVNSVNVYGHFWVDLTFLTKLKMCVNILKLQC